jgi:hypothetical protein
MGDHIRINNGDIKRGKISGYNGFAAPYAPGQAHPEHQ